MSPPVDVMAYPTIALPTVATSEVDVSVMAGFASLVDNVYVAVAVPEEFVAVIV